MIKNWLTGINLGIAGVAALLLLLGVTFRLMRPSEISMPEFPPEKSILPKRAFSMPQGDYDSIGPPLLNLRFSPMSLQLPDLRHYLAFYGRNERPDARAEQSLLHFSFVGSQDVVSILPEKPLYLVYDKDQPRVKYRFSPNNAETSLWIEATVENNEAVVNVAMRNEAGEIIRKPEEYSRFTLKPKELSRFGSSRWDLGKWKVDGTLLARQRAKWFGKDVFLEKHGGEEYEDIRDKHRIDFGEDEEAYSIYVAQGDALAWKNGRWQNVEPGGDTRMYPLLVVTAVEDRLMKLELWEVDGKSKVALNLIKTSPPPQKQDIEQTFKFVGARTRSQLMFEVKNERMILSPQDWLLLSNGQWKKLTTEKEIDDYVDRKTIGPLFVIDTIDREDARQVLLGTLFNPSRTEMEPVEIPLQQSSGPPQGPSEQGRDEEGKNLDRERRPLIERLPVRNKDERFQIR